MESEEPQSSVVIAAIEHNPKSQMLNNQWLSGR